MNDKIEIKPQVISPLKKICMTIGELPTSYLETMTYYEMLIWFTNYLRDTIIPVVNNNGEAVTELQNLFVELQSYVNDYFDNLDVQEEINNKLDQMLEDGALEQIIEQFLQSTALWCFDTVAGMKTATNLVNGSYVKTMGFYQLNDGGGNTYKIRTKTVDDVTNEMTLIAVNDTTLVAELILNNNIINVKQFGAYCDNTHDDSNALETCLNYTGTLASSNGTWKRTILIPAIMKVTRKIECKTDQIKMMGTSLNNARIVFYGANSYIEFGKDNDERAYELEIENIKFYGNYENEHSLMVFKKYNNVYLTRVETCNGGENQYNISFINTGIIFMDKCTVTGSNDVANYPGNRNGIYIETMGSIFNFTNANCWNLNNLFKFKGNVQNVNIRQNWIECIKSFIEVDCATDMRYMNFKVCDNTINTHAQSEAFYPTTFKFFDFDMENDTIFTGSNITFDDNTVYLWDVTSIVGNSFVYFNQIGGSTSANFNINYNRNTYSGKSLYQLSAYVFYNSTTAFYNTNTIRITSFTSTAESDRLSITDQPRIIGCNYTGVASRINEFPNGVYLAQNSSYNKGNLYYDNGSFYGGYNGTVKMLPERLPNTSIPYATNETILTVVNQITDILVSSHICNRQSQ